MPKQIRWSLLSELDFSNILEYLEIEWGKAVVNKYIDRMEDSLNQIRNNPRQYPLINKKRKFLKINNETLSVQRYQQFSILMTKKRRLQLIFNED